MVLGLRRNVQALQVLQERIHRVLRIHLNKKIVAKRIKRRPRIEQSIVFAGWAPRRKFATRASHASVIAASRLATFMLEVIQISHVVGVNG